MIILGDVLMFCTYLGYPRGIQKRTGPLMLMKTNDFMSHLYLGTIPPSRMQSSPPGLFIKLIMGLFGKNEGP